jgi:hypothetical protein
MERLILQSLRWSLWVTLWSAKAPFVMARQVYRVTRQLAGARVLAGHDALPCSGCGALVSLVGRFECGRCHYVFDGFAFSGCAVCGAIPPYITCQSCGVGFRNPVL